MINCVWGAGGDDNNDDAGEEDWLPLFCHRAKLYRFDAGQWKERGIGEMKIMQHKDKGKCLMSLILCLKGEPFIANDSNIVNLSNLLTMHYYTVQTQLGHCHFCHCRKCH